MKTPLPSQIRTTTPPISAAPTPALFRFGGKLGPPPESPPPPRLEPPRPLNKPLSLRLKSRQSSSRSGGPSLRPPFSSSVTPAGSELGRGRNACRNAAASQARPAAAAAMRRRAWNESSDWEGKVMDGGVRRREDEGGGSASSRVRMIGAGAAGIVAVAARTFGG